MWPASDDDKFQPSQIGKIVRVFVHWPMIRENPRALIRLNDHIQAPFCFLHAAVRITEALLAKLQVSDVPFHCT